MRMYLLNNEMPLLSIIIPTHNRSKYAIKTINSLLTIDGEIEIVVTDTSEDDKISLSFSNHPKRDCLKIYRPGFGLSVVDNFNIGLSESTGEYIVFIGDDDFVANEIIGLVKWAKLKAVDAVKFTFPVYYNWPDFRHKKHGLEYGSKLYINKFTGQIEAFDAKTALVDVLNHPGYGVMDMPRAYLGLLSRELLNIIQKKYGVLFGGVSPDIYSAAMISSEARNCVKIDYPIIIPGASGPSGSGLSASGKHIGLLKDSSYIMAFKDLTWDDTIPEFYSVPTVWAFSLLKAFNLLGPNSGSFNYERLYLKCFYRHPNYIRYTFKALCAYTRNKGFVSVSAGMARAIADEVFWALNKVWKRILMKLTPGRYRVKTIEIDNINNVEEASVIFEEYIHKENIKLLNLNS